MIVLVTTDKIQGVLAILAEVPSREKTPNFTKAPPNPMGIDSLPRETNVEQVKTPGNRRCQGLFCQGKIKA